MSSTTPVSGRRRLNTSLEAESEALCRINKETAERLAKRQLARDEARKIRVSEIEKQQREAEKAEAKGAPVASHSNLTVTHNGLLSQSEKQDLEEKVADYEEQHRRDMLLFSQLDNEKSALKYELSLLKDDMDEQRELLHQCRTEARQLNSDLSLKNRQIEGLEGEKEALKYQIRLRDTLIHQSGLMLIEKELKDEEIAGSSGHDLPPGTSSRLLSLALNRKPGDPITETLTFSQNTVAMIDRAIPGNGSLDEKVRKIVNTNRAIRTQLEEAEHALHQRRAHKFEMERQAMQNGTDIADMQKEAQKVSADLKFKLSEMERERANLEGLNSRLESQVKRFKEQLEDTDKELTELKLTNRNLKKDLREKEISLDETQQTNKHLQNRLEKLRQNRQKLD